MAGTCDPARNQGAMGARGATSELPSGQPPRASIAARSAPEAAGPLG